VKTPSKVRRAANAALEKECLEILARSGVPSNLAYQPLFLKLAAHSLGKLPRRRIRTFEIRTTKISWALHTNNGWIGCHKIALECAHCYACDIDSFWYGGRNWGIDAERHRTSPATWAKALKWELDALQRGQSQNVFCMSMGDVFEERAELDAWRKDLFFLIESCPHLNWLLLTKRSQLITRMVPPSWLMQWPKHVVAGVSAGHESTLWQIANLLEVPAGMRFVSVEPLLSPIDLSPYLSQREEDGSPKTKFVMCGGESGRGARPTHIDWVRKVRDQCLKYGVAFHYKQHGCWIHESQVPGAGLTRLPSSAKSVHTWPDGTKSYRVNVKLAGHKLDGVEYQAVVPTRYFAADSALQTEGGVA